MSEDKDPLWDPEFKGDAEFKGHSEFKGDPECKGDPETQRLQLLLAPYSVKARGVADWMPKKAPAKSSVVKFAKIMAAGLAASLLLFVGHRYRLAWDEGQPWQVSSLSISETTLTSLVAPGGLLETNQQQSLSIDVARIGHMTLSPNSKLRLLETRANRHRVNLESGHLRATIWAPPGYFGVTTGTAELIDLGCDFELWKNTDGNGRVHVRSGWVAYKIGAYEVLVPAGYEMKFNAQRPFTPLRPDTNLDFAKAVRAFEQVAQPEVSAIALSLAADRVAGAAQDADAFTLLSLLTQYPQLAASALYPRLGIALKIPSIDLQHRNAWAAGNLNAMNSWWDRYPTQPKNWWANWADAFR